MATWIDFRTLREQLRFADVLNSYGVHLRVKGDRATGFCPLPSHDAGKGPTRKRSPSFSANLARGIWQCFGCRAKGNVLDFAAHMEGFDPADSKALRRVALKLQERFGLSAEKPRQARTEHSLRQTSEPVEAEKREACATLTSPNPAAVEDSASSHANTLKRQEHDPSKSPEHLPRLVNAPLDFSLKHLDGRHPYLQSRQISPRTVEHFGIGYCPLGLMAGRIAIPLHDEQGRLVGYAGRIVDDAKIGPECPKYKLPGERARNGVVHEFRKSCLLFNAHRLAAPVSELIVVEGFFSVLWLCQHGYENVVALMGSACSDQQLALVISLVMENGRVVMFTDGDEAGDHCVRDLMPRLSPHRAMRWATAGDGRQPTDCSGSELTDILGAPIGMSATT